MARLLKKSSGLACFMPALDEAKLVLAHNSIANY